MKPKTYNFKGKTVIAVPETAACAGCIYNISMEMPDECYKSTQKAARVPDCVEREIIFKLATDEQ